MLTIVPPDLTDFQGHPVEYGLLVLVRILSTAGPSSGWGGEAVQDWSEGACVSQQSITFPMCLSGMMSLSGGSPDSVVEQRIGSGGR